MVICSQAVRADPIFEINTTPLIDVMLVLLVMFIITIPIQTQALKLDLPRPITGRPPQPTVNLLEITRDGSLLWNEQPITPEGLAYDLQRTQQMNPVPELHLRPEAYARYGAVSEVLGIIQREHVRKFGFEGNEAYRNW